MAQYLYIILLDHLGKKTISKYLILNLLKTCIHTLIVDQNYHNIPHDCQSFLKGNNTSLGGKIQREIASILKMVNFGKK